MPGSLFDEVDAIGRLAGRVAHEYNNLLAVVVSYAELLAASLDDGDPRGADVAEIRRAAERAAALTRQLLALGQPGALDPRPLALEALLIGLQPSVRRALGEQIALRVIDAGVPPVVIDQGQLEQALINLIANARAAMPDGGAATIDLTTVELDAPGAARLGGLRTGRYAVIGVTDSGVGMDAETRRRAVEPFFTTQPWGQATGLGLSITSAVVQQAGGALTIDSEPGRGSTVRIFLPARGGPPSPRPAAASAPAVAGIAGTTILVVDDEPPVRAVVARILQVAGCTVLQASGAEEARHLCATYPGAIDVLLADVMLADGRGDLLAIELIPMRPSQRVLLMSGYPGEAPVSWPGGPPLLAKPFTPTELRAALGAVVGAASAGAGAPSRRTGGVRVGDDDHLAARPTPAARG